MNWNKTEIKIVAEIKYKLYVKEKITKVLKQIKNTFKKTAYNNITKS